MMNFAEMPVRYRERIEWETDELMGLMIKEHVVHGGKFEAEKITRMFNTACQIGQLIVDLEISSGLHILEKEDVNESNQENKAETIGKASRSDHEEAIAELTRKGNDISDLGTGDSKGPTGSDGNEGGVPHSDSESDQTSHNRAAGSGKVNLAE